MNMENVCTLVGFSASFAKILSAHRLPPTYVGVPRRRPSSKEVQSAWRKKSDRTQPSFKISFIVNDEAGNERRMTKQEKKEAKRQMLEERRESRRKFKPKIVEEVTNAECDQEILRFRADNLPKSPERREIYQLPVNDSSVEEELADLRRERDGVPPVALLPCMALQSLKVGIPISQLASIECAVDSQLAEKWVKSLKESLREAEEVRAQENIRPMAYEMVPEAWNRMMPDLSEPMSEATVLEKYHEKDWAWIPVRPRVEPLDSDKDIVCSLLHSRSNIHISCGSKFGCDFLLYDGPRSERHAFAGLRVVPDGALPRPYDLHGYVRCLHTAGKLSLLAKVVRTVDIPKVAFVDLTLEKVMSASHVGKLGYKRKRREVGNNLTKRKDLN